LGVSPQDARHALSLLERAGAVRVHRPFAGKVIRTLLGAPFAELGFNVERVRERERRSLLLLKRMTDYAYTKRCRRRFILEYFGEDTDGARCDSCDVCVGSRAAKRRAKAKPDALGPATNAKLDYSELAASELRRFRRDLARDIGLAPFHIFNDKTLLALATALPIKREEFLAVKGTGERHWERFGAQVVEICLLARAAGHVPKAVPRTRPPRRRASPLR
jgi:ATP-dependent DNA helicase RecQ